MEELHLTLRQAASKRRALIEVLSRLFFPASNRPSPRRATADRGADCAARVRARRCPSRSRSRRASSALAWLGPTRADAPTPISPRPPRITSLPTLLRKPGPPLARPPRPAPGRGRRRRRARRHRRRPPPRRPPRPPPRAARSRAPARSTAWRGAR